MSLFQRAKDPRDLVIEHQAQMISDLMDRLQELIGQIHYHQVQRNTAPAVEEPPVKRLHIDEDEDDALFAYRTGQIDKRELEERLADLGFENTTLEIDFA